MVDEKKKFEKLSVRIIKRIERKIQDVALEVHANVTEDTPVLTGWAANNWLPNIKRPRTETVGSPDKVDTSSASTGLIKIASWKSGDGPIFITNNVPYIGRLNAGSSVKAPAGFVEKAVQRAVKKLR